MGKREIRPLATPKPLNRSSQKVAHVIMSWISTDMQNLETIPQGVSFPHMREFAHQKYLLDRLFSGFFQRPTAQAPEEIFTQNTSNHAVPSKDVPFRGQNTKNLTFNPIYSRKTAILGPLLTGQIFRPKIALQWGCSHVNSP